jgi:hypothetical protein
LSRQVSWVEQLSHVFIVPPEWRGTEVTRHAVQPRGSKATSRVTVPTPLLYKSVARYAPTAQTGLSVPHTEGLGIWGARGKSGSLDLWPRLLITVWFCVLKVGFSSQNQTVRTVCIGA